MHVCMFVCMCAFYLFLSKFFTPAWADGFSLDFEWQQVYSSLQDSSQYSVGSQQCCSLIVSTHPFIFEFSSPCTNSFLTVQRVPIITDIIITFMLYRFLSYLAKSRYVSFFLISYNFTLHSAVTATSTILQIPCFFLLIMTRCVRLIAIRGSVCISKSQKSSCLILQDRFYVVHIPFIYMVKFKFLEQ